MSKETTLQFPSLWALYLFCAAVQLDFFELNSRTFVLTAPCSEEDISLAVIRYGATLILDQGARIGRVHP